MLIIGLAGRKGSGKSTVAHIMEKEGFVELAFADPLKEAAAVLLGVPKKWMFKARLEDKEAIVPGFNFTYRSFLQKLGTEFARDSISTNFWVDRMDVRLYGMADKFIVVSDVRFDNEAEYILSKNGVIIDIQRDSTPADDHITEKGVSEHLTKYKLSNNGSMNDLYTDIKSIVKDIMVKENK
jgi:hypothetical protein